MLNCYGWLMVYGNVDHPSAKKHGGDVYIHKDDVVSDEPLCPGDVVSFYLYADDQGLGAEECRVESKAATSFNPRMSKRSMRPSAPEFVPSAATVESALDQGPYAWSDPVALNDVFFRLSKVFASDDEDEEELEVMKPDAKFEVMKPDAKRAPSSDGSTCEGSVSDTDDDGTHGSCSSDCEVETSVRDDKEMGLAGLLAGFTNFRPPPGLDPPPELRKVLMSL